jgi:hypothetical protein
MADAARKVATYADVLAAPPHMVAEIVDGELNRIEILTQPKVLTISATSRCAVFPRSAVLARIDFNANQHVLHSGSRQRSSSAGRAC